MLVQVEIAPLTLRVKEEATLPVKGEDLLTRRAKEIDLLTLPAMATGLPTPLETEADRPINKAAVLLIHRAMEADLLTRHGTETVLPTKLAALDPLINKAAVLPILLAMEADPLTRRATALDPLTNKDQDPLFLPKTLLLKRERAKSRTKKSLKDLMKKQDLKNFATSSPHAKESDLNALSMCATGKDYATLKMSKAGESGAHRIKRVPSLKKK